MKNTVRSVVVALAITACLLAAVWAMARRDLVAVPTAPTSSTTPTAEATGTPVPTPSASPSNLPPPPQPTGLVPTTPTKTVVYKVMTSGPATVTYGAIGSEPVTVDVDGDWSARVQVTELDVTARVKVTARSGGTVSCEILVNDTSVSRRDGTGDPAQATCAANVLVVD